MSIAEIASKRKAKSRPSSSTQTNETDVISPLDIHHSAQTTAIAGAAAAMPNAPRPMPVPVKASAISTTIAAPCAAKRNQITAKAYN